MAATPYIRATIYFTIPGFTWSESYYTALTDYVAADASFSPVAAARGQMLGYGAQIRTIVYHTTTAPRTSYVRQLATPYSSSIYVASGGAASVTTGPWNTVVLVGVGAAKQERRGYVGGVPSGFFSEQPGANNAGLNYAFVPSWPTQVGLFVGALAQNGWGWLGRNYAAAVPIKNLVTTGGPNGELGIQLGGLLTFPGPITVWIKGYRRLNTKLPGVGGQYRIDQAVAGPFPPPTAGPFIYWLLGVPSAYAANAGGQGEVAVVAPSLVPYQNPPSVTGAFYLDTATHHKRGVRVLAPLGRSRARA